MVLAAALICAAGGCAAKPKLKAYAGELPPEQLAELYLDSRVRLVSVDGKQFPGGTDDEVMEKTRALEEAQGVAESGGGHYPRRVVQVPAGEREFVFGLARHMVPVKRETHMAVVLLSGDVSYTSKMYPGSTETVAARMTLVPKHVYRVYPLFDRPGGSAETWKFSIKDTQSSKAVPVEIRKTTSPAPGGTPLGPTDWAEAERVKLEAKRQEAKK